MLRGSLMGGLAALLLALNPSVVRADDDWEDYWEDYHERLEEQREDYEDWLEDHLERQQKFYRRAYRPYYHQPGLYSAPAYQYRYQPHPYSGPYGYGYSPYYAAPFDVPYRAYRPGGFSIQRPFFRFSLGW